MPIPISQPFEKTAGGYLLDDTNLKGGYRIVATLTDRNNIPLSARKVGMVVSVVADKTEYILNTNIANSSWIPKSPFSGTLVNTTELLYIKGNV